MRSFGAFGKIPVLGDFFRTGLDNGFISGWDDWLQQRMLEAAEALGDRWEGCYMSAPIWRFSLAQGLAGETAVSGVLMPSVDRVGRKFPLTLATTHVEPADALVRHFANGPVFDQLEGLALDALDDTMTLDHMKDRISQIEMPDEPAVSFTSVNRACVRGAGSLDAALAATVAASVPPGASIWTAHIDGEARLAVCEGLPSHAEMIELLDADASVWQERDI